MDGETTGAITLTVAQAAAFAGVSSKTVYRAIEDGRLTATVLGRATALRIRPEWIDDWIESNAYVPRTRSPRSRGNAYAQRANRHQPRRGYLSP